VKVYIVCNGALEPEGVYSTKEKAINAFKEEFNDKESYYSLDIYEVDSEDEYNGYIDTII